MPLQLSPPRLAAARRGAGLSQQQAATRVGIAISTLQAAEYGKNEPRASVIARLAQLYGVDLWSLFDGHPPDGEGAFAVAPPPDGSPDGGEAPALADEAAA